MSHSDTQHTTKWVGVFLSLKQQLFYDETLVQPIQLALNLILIKLCILLLALKSWDAFSFAEWFHSIGPDAKSIPNGHCFIVLQNDGALFEKDKRSQWQMCQPRDRAWRNVLDNVHDEMSLARCCMTRIRHHEMVHGEMSVRQNVSSQTLPWQNASDKNDTTPWDNGVAGHILPCLIGFNQRLILHRLSHYNFLPYVWFCKLEYKYISVWRAMLWSLLA